MVDPDEASVEFYQRCANNLPFFIENVLGYKLADFHKEELDLMLRHRYVCIINPASHGKTTLFSVCYPIWLLWKESNFEICIVSSTEEQARRPLGIIQKTIEENEFLQHLVPSAKTVKWGSSYLSTTNGNKCFTKPFSDSARGEQPDVLVYDDLLRQRDVSMDLIKEIFWTVFIPRGQAKGSKHVVVGTPQDDDDLLAEIENEHKDQWATVRKSAVITDDIGNWKKPLWPDVFTLSDLKHLKKSMGTYRFNREYMCEPAGIEGGLFPPDMIAENSYESLGFSFKIKGDAYMGADFAMSDSPTGDYTVFTVVDYIRDKEYEIEDRVIRNPIIIKYMERKKGGSRKWHIDRMKYLVEAYKPKEFIADQSTFGEVFIQDLRDEGIIATPQSFQSKARNKLLLGLRKYMEEGRILIPIKQDKKFTFNTTKYLLDELKGFEEAKTRADRKTFRSSKKHDDTVDSLAMAVSKVRDKRPMPKKIIFSR